MDKANAYEARVILYVIVDLLTWVKGRKTREVIARRAKISDEDY